MTRVTNKYLDVRPSVTFFLIASILSFSSASAGEILNKEAKDYLIHNVPKGIYSAFSCSQSVYAFGNKKCSVMCKESGKIIFEISNVRNAFYSRSADRVAIVVDTFENSNYRKGADSFASLASTVSCFFNQLKPEI